jgi:cell shape-determining protein MreC
MSLLRPTAAVTNDAITFSRDRIGWLEAAMADGQRAAEAERQASKLKEENDRLASALDAVRLMKSSADSVGPGAATAEPLLQSDAVVARVLGHSAQSFMRGRELLDIGSRSGVSPGAIVLDGDAPNDRTQALVDAGSDLALQPGRLVLAGRRVWGKLATVGTHTSVVRRITDPGYRDTVQIAHSESSGASPHLGPRGVLVGSGERLCRIELVEASEPVSVGDGVYTESDGLLSEPLIYGQVVRVELAADKLHWQIWMQPAIGSDAPREVAVLRTELNPARVGMVSGER